MAHTSQGEDLEKDHRRNAKLPDSADKHSKVDSTGLESRLRGKSTLVPLKRKYPHNRHNRFHPLPPYYTGPPHPAYYHPYYYHYPMTPRSYHPNHFRTTSAQNHYRFSTNSKSKVSKAFDPAIRKTNVNNKPQKNVRLQKSIQKQKEDKKKQKITIVKKGNDNDEVNTKKGVGTDVVPTPPTTLMNPESTVNPTLPSNKRPPLSTKCRSSTPASSTISSTKENEIVVAKKGKVASVSTEIDLQRDLPSDRVNDDSRLPVSCREVHDERTRMEVEDLGDALGLEIKIESFDFSVVKTNESSYHWNEVRDPVDSKLMSSAKFVTFQNLGVGLDSKGNQLQKEESEPMIKKVPCMQKSKKCGRCPTVNRNPGSDPQPNKTFSSKGPNLQKTAEEIYGISSLKLINPDDSESGQCEFDFIESRLAAVKSSEKISSHQIGAFNDTLTEEQNFDPSKDEMRGLLKYSIYLGDDREGNKSDEGNAKDRVYDSTPPFPMDDMTENIRFHDRDCNGKMSICKLKTGSAVGSSGSDGIFRISSVSECQKEEVTMDKYNKSSTTNTDDTASKPLTEVEITDDDVCFDSYIRSLISEDDEEDSLIRPPSPVELMSPSLLPVVALMEPPISF